MKTAYLKNYTSTVPVSETIKRIEAVLIRCGVQAITKEYGPNAETMALHFTVPATDGVPEITIRLPANKVAALEAMWRDYVGDDAVSDNGNFVYNARKTKRKSDFREQAERTAWKLMQDWVEVQMSLVVFKQAEVREVFMPYIWDGRETFYQQLKAGGFKALPERCETTAKNGTN